MSSLAMSDGNWSYTGSPAANYTISQDFQSTPTYEDMYGGADHVSKNMSWSMDTRGKSLTSISGSGSDLAYTLTTQETATDNSSGIDSNNGRIEEFEFLLYNPWGGKPIWTSTKRYYYRKL